MKTYDPSDLKPEFAASPLLTRCCGVISLVLYPVTSVFTASWHGIKGEWPFFLQRWGNMADMVFLPWAAPEDAEEPVKPAFEEVDPSPEFQPCDLGMDCDEHGSCYAEGQGEPQMCGRLKPVPHQWDSDGETCLSCGDKDWFAGPACNGRRSGD